MAEPITPMLGDVELRSIQHIKTLEQRALVEHRVPGMTGGAFQDLGRPSACIKLSGVLFGEEARAGLETLRQKFQAAEPLPFTADITTATEIVDVLIEDLRVVEIAGRPNTFIYEIVLRESPPPPPPIDPLAPVNADVLGDAQDLFDQAVALADVINSLENIPDFGDPTEPLSSLLDDVKAATNGLPELLDPLTSLIGEPPPPDG
jgi:hypothetical protein